MLILVFTLFVYLETARPLAYPNSSSLTFHLNLGCEETRCFIFAQLQIYVVVKAPHHVIQSSWTVIRMQVDFKVGSDRGTFDGKYRCMLRNFIGSQSGLLYFCLEIIWGARSRGSTKDKNRSILFMLQLLLLHLRSPLPVARPKRIQFFFLVQVRGPWD